VPVKPSSTDATTLTSRKPRQGEVRLLRALGEEADNWVWQYYLQTVHGLSPDTIQTWLRRLLDHGYVERRESFRGKRLRAKYRLTSAGRAHIKRRLEEASLEAALANDT